MVIKTDLYESNLGVKQGGDTMTNGEVVPVSMVNILFAVNLHEKTPDMSSRQPIKLRCLLS